MTRLQLFAATAPGISRITAAELEELGIPPADVLPDGVTFAGDMRTLARTNLWLRTASRVVVRAARFRARTFAELERHASDLDWRKFIAAGAPAAFRITSRKSRLFHTGAIAERLARVAAAEIVRAGGEQEENAQLFIVRGVRDEWTISADTSGAHLHRRGYRLATAKAPLRETLAAAVVLASGWDRSSPLVDPFCGSGTICVEAALIAGARPPGEMRDFRFMHWPEYDATLLDGMREAGVASEAHIHGYDRDAGAIAAALSNAGRARVAEQVRFAPQAISVLEPPANRGWIVTNPPYGVRVGEGGDLRDLYARFGAIVRERCSGWTVAYLSADAVLDRATRLPVEPILRTENGGLRVRLMRGRVS